MNDYLTHDEVVALGVDPNQLVVAGTGERYYRRTDVERARYRLDNPDAMTRREAETEFGADVWDLPTVTAAGEKWLSRPELQRLLDAGQIDRVISVEQVAALTGYSVPSVYRMAQQGKIPSFKVAGGVRFREGEVRRMLETRRVRL